MEEPYICYTETIEIDAVRADDDQYWRILRIHRILGYAQALADLDGNTDYFKKIKSMFDFKGSLSVEWHNVPEDREKNYLWKAWESIVTDYETNPIEHLFPKTSIDDLACKIPVTLIKKKTTAAPSYPYGEKTGRYPGVFTESGQDTRSYSDILIYVQNGLSSYELVFDEVAKAVVKIQKGGEGKYRLYVFGFGQDPELFYPQKFFSFGTNELSVASKIKNAFLTATGTVGTNLSVLRSLLPEKHPMLPPLDKSKVCREDLILIIGRKDEVFLDKALESKIKPDIRKHLLLVEIGTDAVVYDFKPVKNIFYEA